MFVSILMVRALLEECRARGVTADALLDGTGLTSEALSDGLRRLPAMAFGDLARRAMQLTGDESLGLALGTRLQAQALQVIGYLLASAPTLRDAYRDFQRYAAVLAENPSWAMREEGEHAHFEFSCPLSDASLLRMANDWALSLACRIIRGYAPLASHDAVEIGFAHPKPKYAAAYAGVLGTKIRFGRGQNVVSFPRAWLDRSQLHGDAATCAGLRDMAEHLLATVGSHGRVSDRLRVILWREPNLSRINAAELARKAGLSQTALRRKLAVEGASPSRLMDEARCRVACAELDRVDASVKQVALKLGYTETRSFHRAFKRWTGKTPADYRAQTLQGPSVQSAPDMS